MKLQHPFDSSLLLLKKKAIQQELSQQAGLIPKRVAVFGGSTSQDLVDQLDIFLLSQGIQATFYQSEYKQYYEDALFPNDTLKAFKPDVIYIYTTAMNISTFPQMSDSQKDVDLLFKNQLAHFQSIWDAIAQHFACPIIQNNFEEHSQRPLGNLDATDYRGRTRFISRLNNAFAEAAAQRSNLIIHDIHYLSARIGLDNWFDARGWYLYKQAINIDVLPQVAHHLAAVMLALWGKTHKCLVLDLDNTLWGGVIGDDDLSGIQLGVESAEGEAFSDFQQYVLALKNRGIILAICSKNDETNARLGFSHPDSLLKADDFTAFKANWEPKSQNMEAIAEQINIGLDSLVFVDDNAVERDIIRAQLSSVSVPEIGSDISNFIRLLDQAALFETTGLSEEDIKRTQLYHQNAKRETQEAKFASYDEFLTSLEMSAEIKPFAPIYAERITQLINKTNQFNLTTKRVSLADIEAMMLSKNHITLYGRLQDKFGDNGLIAVMAGEIKNSELHIDLNLMSCRVLKRGMEQAMMMRLCELAVQRNIKTIVGYYLPTAKNNMVAGFYESFGFTKHTQSEKEVVWQLDVSKGAPVWQHVIRVG